MVHLVSPCRSLAATGVSSEVVETASASVKRLLQMQTRL